MKLKLNKIFVLVRRSQKTKGELSVATPVLHLSAFLPVLLLIFLAFSPLLYTPKNSPLNQTASALTNNTINFQARLLTNTGALVPDGNYHIEFKLYDSLAAGGSSQGVCSTNSSTDDCWWRETRTTGNLVSVKNGYISVALGSVTPFGANIPWDQELWLTMNIGGAGGSASWNGEMTPRMKITSVPFAQSANKLKGASGLYDADQLAQLAPASAQAINSTNTAIRINQTGTGSLLQLQSGGNDRLLLAANGNLTVAGTGVFQGASVSIGTTTQAGVLTLSDGSSNTTTIQSAAISSNLTFTLPATNGTSGDCLVTNGTGVLSFSSTCGAGGSGSAPNNAQYLTLAYDSGLSNERLLSAGTNISVTDNGANNTLVIAVANSPTFSGTLTVQGASISVGTTSQAGSLVLSDGSSNTTTLQSAAIASNLTFILPSGYGGSGDCIVGDASGNLSFSSTCGTGGSGSAPIAASYITVGLDGSLTNERVLTGGSNISITDGGANGNLTVGLVNNSLTVTAGTGLTGGGSVALGGSTTISLNNSGVTSGSYGSANTVATFSVDSQGRLTSATNTSIAINGNQITSGSVGVGYGGTGLTSYTTGDLLYASGATTLSKLAAVASGSCLVSQGVGVAPTWSACVTGGSANYIQNQSASAQGSSNFWISGDGRADTSLSSPTFKSTGTGNLTVNAAGANSLLLQTNGTTRFTLSPSASTLTGSGATSIVGGAALNLSATGANALTLGTNGSTRLTVTSTGDVNVANNLQIGGTTTITSTRLVQAADGSAGGPAYSFTNSTNMGMYRIDANNLGFSVAGTERLRVTTTGAQVNGDLAVSGKITQGGYLALDNDNLVYNGDFETNTTAGWFKQSGVGTIATTTGGNSGNYTLQAVNSADVVSEDYIPVDPTKDTLQFEAYVKETVTGTTPGVIYAGYIAYNAAKTAITTAPCGTYCYFASASYNIPNDGNWHKLNATTSGEGTSYPNFPVGTKYVRVLFLANYSSAGGETTLIDHVSVRKINNGPLYVGGDFTSTNLIDNNQVSKLYTDGSNNLNIQAVAGNGNIILTPNGSGYVNIASNLYTGGTQRLSSAGALSNITGYSQTSGAYSFSGGGNFSIDSSGLDVTTTGTITGATWNGNVIADTYINDALTVSSAGSVDWSALTNYPGACSAGQAITQLGDTITCSSFASSSGSGNYIQNQYASAQSSSNFWISGNGRLGGSLTVDTGSTFTGTTNIFQNYSGSGFMQVYGTGDGYSGGTMSIFKNDSVDAANNYIRLQADANATPINFADFRYGGSNNLVINNTAGGGIALNGANVTIAQDLTVTGADLTLGADVTLSRGAANRLDLATGDSLNLSSTGNVQTNGTTRLTGAGVFQAANGTVSSPAYSFSGDSNTGIYSVAADTLGFSTNGTERLRVQSDGATNFLANNLLNATVPIGGDSMNYIAGQYNMLNNATNRPGYTVTQPGAVRTFSPLSGLFDGDMNPIAASGDVTPATPAVVQVDFPTLHTQVGGVAFGWNSRYWYPKDFIVELNTSSDNVTFAWETVANETGYAKRYYQKSSPIVKYVKGYRITITDDASNAGLQIGDLYLQMSEGSTPYQELYVSSQGGNIYGGNLNLTSGSLLTNGTTRLTNAGVLQNVSHGDAGNFFTAGTLTVNRGGTGAGSFTANGVLYGNNTGALQSTAASTATNQCLITTTAGGAPSWGSCTAGGGVTTVGALNGGTANANGATISGNTIYLQSASSSNAGLVDTGSQTFAGAKTFNGQIIQGTAGKWLSSGTDSSYSTIHLVTLGRSSTGYGTVGDGYRTTTTGNLYTYDRADYATQIDFSSGNISFKTAPIGVAGNNVSWTVPLVIDNNAPSNTLYLKNTGNVGVGTTTPENAESWNRVLDVYGASHSKIITTTSNIQTGLWSHNSGIYGALAGGMTGTRTNHPFSIVTNGSSRLTVDTAGNVGIGDTSPTNKLDVNGSIGISDTTVITSGRLIQAADGAVGGPAYSFSSDTNTGMYNIAADTLGFSTGGTERLRVDTNGAAFNGLFRAGGNYYNVVSYNYNGTPTNAIKIKTNIPYTSSSQMPTINIKGYSYGDSAPIDINIVWYILGGNFLNYKASSSGGVTPTIKLANEGGLVTITLEYTPYYARFQVNAFAQGMSETPSWFNGWTVADEAAGATNQVTVAYQNRFGTITGGTWNGTSISDAYLDNNITVSSAGTVDWTALNNYPAACAGGSAITQLGDSVTCTAFAPASGSTNYIQAQGTTPGTAQNTNFNIGTGTGIAANLNATTAFLLNGTNINTAGTLTNVAYENQANTFTAINVFNSSTGTGDFQVYGQGDGYGGGTMALFKNDSINSTNNYIRLQADANGTPTNFADFQYGGSNNLVINNTAGGGISLNGGNVGVGTVATYKLDVNGKFRALSGGFGDYTTFKPSGLGLKWVRIPYSSYEAQNTGALPVHLFVTRSIFDDGSVPYGGPSLELKCQNREWHGGQQFCTAQYGYHGNTGAEISHAAIIDNAAGGNYIYLRLYGGVTYKITTALDSPRIGVPEDNATGAPSVSASYALTTGLNIIGDGSPGLNVVGNISANQLSSAVSTGTAPLTVSSTTVVTNLNADLLDGLNASAFAPATGSSSYVQLQGSTPGSAQTGNLNISGTAIVGALTSGAITTTGNFSQTGATTFSTGTGTNTFNGATSITSTLSVTGNATFDTNTLFVDAALNRVGIGTASPSRKLEVYGGHGDTQLLLHSIGDGGATNTADLMLWASEPGHTYTGVGIANNLYNTTGFPRINTNRGGSMIRLLDNSMRFSTVNSSGTQLDGLVLDGSGNLTAAGVIQGTRFTSTIATGTSPFTVTSTTVVTNLNADYLDGLHASAFAPASGSGNYIQNQNSSAQSSSNFWISGEGKANNLVVTGTGGVLQFENTATLQAKNSGGTYEQFLWPRWSDNTTYLNYGAGGFNIRNNSSSSTLFMGNNGNVSVGTTGSSYRLTVNYAAPATFTNAAGDFNQMWQAGGTNIFGVAASTSDTTTRLVTNNGYNLAFHANGSVSPALSINTASQIEVKGAYGYLNPALKLTNSTSSPAGSFRFNPQTDGAGGFISFNGTVNTTTNGTIVSGSSTITGDLAVRRTGVFEFVGAASDSGSAFNFYTANGNAGSVLTQRFRIQADGNVGIGTANPAAKLTVNGSILASANSYLNFGATSGSAGYGIRDNAGTLQVKNSGGSWQNIGAAVWTSASGILNMDAPTDILRVNGANAYSYTTSVLVNGDLEQWNAGNNVPIGYGTFWQAGSTVSRSSTHYGNVGSYSAASTFAAGSNGYQRYDMLDSFDVSPGEFIEVSAYGFYSGTAGGVVPNLSIGILLNDSANDPMFFVSGAAIYTVKDCNLTTSWAECRGTFQIPAGKTRARIVISPGQGNAAGAITAYVDKIQAQKRSFAVTSTGVGINAGKDIFFGREELFGGVDTGGSDYGYIHWDNDNNAYNYWGDSTENGALIIGVQNDGNNVNSDVLVQYSPAAVITHSREQIWQDGASITNKYANIYNGGFWSNGSITADSAVYASNWFRSYGQTGWYNENYGAGIYSIESNVVRTYQNNSFRVYGNYNYMQLWTNTGTNAAYIGVNNSTSALALNPGAQWATIGDPGQRMSLSLYTQTSNCTIHGSLSCTSDERLKYIDSSATGNLAKIMQLQPTYYRYKSDPGTQKLGLIAQNVQTVLPEFVSVDSQGYLLLDTAGLVTPLIGAVQEQQAMITDAQNRLTALENSIQPASNNILDLTNGGTIQGSLNIVGSLNVTGPVTMKSLTVTDDVVIAGNLTVQNVTVANLTVNGHIITAGNAPVATVGTAAGTEDTQNNIAAPQVTIEGNDTAGTITIVAGANTTAGDLAEVTFNQAFSKVPKVILTAGNEQTTDLKFFRSAQTGKFLINLKNAPQAGQTYTFDYFIVE
ncbi:tail fiber domain-containing protein [Candidatus Nomurabacteria bacterium]|nr:tail fiber domain-containing protein [Candidatus Nomurabacteria bacterium]